MWPYLVCYELMSGIRSISLAAALASLRATPLLPNCWVILSNGSASELQGLLAPMFDPSDRLLVVLLDDDIVAANIDLPAGMLR